ncbi:hypothetical protein RB653_005577 [Dictyostelium firmibasis]|uniref:thioredoxin-dependent peroxiredoxin n=1 Tax=Dictyostelium firmibasis TaxID=79012 RepID=A0AAN7YZD4_9MYCE
MTKLKVGDDAPDFSCPDKDGKLVTLKDFIDQKPIVLYFYPKDETTICTKEACEFRDKYQKFIEAGADVIGVSRDDADSHSKFTSKYSLPFTLLSDKGGELAKLYGAEGNFLSPGRVTFIIDKNGKIALNHSAFLSASSHIEESLKVIEKLKTS